MRDAEDSHWCEKVPVSSHHPAAHWYSALTPLWVAEEEFGLWGARSEKWKSLSPVRLWDPIDYIVHGILHARYTGVGSLSLLHMIFPTQGSNPGLLHFGRILYQLSYKGSPYSENLILLRLAQIHLIVSLNIFLKPNTHTSQGLCVVYMWSLGSPSPGSLLRCMSFFLHLCCRISLGLVGP